MINDYTIQRLDPGNLKDVARLHYEVYGKKKSFKYWKIKYNSEWTGVSYIGYIAYDHLHNPIAFYGVVPCYISNIQGAILAGQCTDAMTHPLHQNHGLFTELEKKIIQLCSDSGIRFLFVFPNQNSYPILKKNISWQSTEKMQYFVFKLPIRPATYLKKITFFKYIYTLYQRIYLRHIITKDCHGIKNSLLNEGYDGIERSKYYLHNKRYHQRFVFTVGDWKIWLKLDEKMTIGDVERGTSAFQDIFRQLKKIAAYLGIREIIFQVTSGTRLYHDLVSVETGNDGFVPMFFVLDSTIDISNIRFTFADIDVF